MYKNQLQELAQRSCFNLPSYACVREGPDHAPRFRATVNFHGEIFHGPSNCTTVRQAEHAAAEVALNNLSTRGPSRSLTARVLDETGVYKNLLQETAHRAGLRLPVYTTVRTGPGHQPIFTCTVELAGMSFSGESAKTKKQAEKNAALAAWSSLKQMPEFGSSCAQQISESESNEEQEQVVVSRVLAKFSSIEENRPVNHRQPQLHRNNQVYPRRKPTWGSRECFAPHTSMPNYQQKWMSLPGSSSETLSKNPIQQSRSLVILPSRPVFPTQEPISSNNSLLLSSFDKPMPEPAKKISQKDLQDILLYLEKQQRKDESQQITRNQPALERMKNHETYNNSADKAHIPLYARSIPSSANTFSQVLKPQVAAAPNYRNSQMANIPNMFATGGFHACQIAPAVNVRSVIPVCAAPPTGRLEKTVAAAKKEDGEISEASSKLNKLQL